MIRVLIIEDNNDIRENAIEMLELAGYSVLAAADGRAGVQMAKETLPDIILSDIMMPLMNGHEVFRALKDHEPTKPIPFVFITSSVEKKEIEYAISNGANGYVKKPFEESELLDAIRKCLAQ